MKIYILLYVFLAAIFLSHYTVARQAVYGDGIDYWVYLHSWYFDHDLNFANEFTHLYAPTYNNSATENEGKDIQKTTRTSTGMVDDVHPLGSAIFLFPLYLLADGAAALRLGVRNGYSDVYQVFAGFGAVGYVVIGVYVTEKFCKKYVQNPALAKLAAFGAILCSPLLYYGAYDVLNSHFASFLLSSLFWYLLFFWYPRQNRRYIGLGCVLGLSMITRNQDVLLLVPFLVYEFVYHRSKIMHHVFLAGLTCAVVLVPMFYQWYVLYGIPLPVTYLVQTRHLEDLLGSLIHPVTGLFTRTPFMLLALGGVPLALRMRERHIHVFLFVLYVVLTWAIVTVQGGWSGAAYGGRMYIGLLPIFAVFIALFFEKLPKLAFPIVGVFFALNVVSCARFVLLEKQVNSGVGAGLEKQTIERVQKLLPITK